MEYFMGSNNQKDYLDSLLFAAAENAGKRDIEEYNATAVEMPVKDVAWLQDIVASEKKTKSARTISFRNKLLIAAAAAVLVSVMAVGTIASLGRDTAPIVVSSVAGKHVLSYDLTGIKSGNDVTDDVPAILEKDFETGACVELPDGRSTIYTNDGTVITYTVRVLDGDYSFTMGDSDLSYTGLLVSGKYHGCMMTVTDGAEKSAVVVWNDGNYAYELSGNTDADTLVGIAQSLY